MHAPGQHRRAVGYTPHWSRELVARTKSTTGCVTCKQRRVKCGEEKPICRRCAKSKRLCGYALTITDRRRAPQASSNRDVFRNTFLTTVPRSPGSQPSHTIDDSALEYFRLVTLPSLSGSFPSELWSKSVLCLAQYSSAMRHCLIAVGSSHKEAEARLNKSKISNSSSDPPSSEPGVVFHLNHYNEAIRQTQKAIASGSVSLGVIRILCLLFLVYEYTCGDRRNMNLHMHQGISLLKSRDPNPSSDDLEVESILSRWSLLHSMYGRPRKARDTFPKLLIAKQPGNTGPFTNLISARICLSNLLTESYDFVRTALFKRAPEAVVDPRKAAMMERLETWMSHFQDSMKDQSQSQDATATNLLLAQYALGHMFLTTCTNLDQTAIDNHVHEFHDIVKWLKPVIAAQKTQTRGNGSLTFDAGVIPLLFYTATRCRNPVVRREAVELLREGPIREGIWDSLEAIQMAEAVIEYEEEGADPSELWSGDWKAAITVDRRVHDVDMQYSSTGRVVSLISSDHGIPTYTAKHISDS